MRKGPRGRKGRFGHSAKMIKGSRSGVQAVQAMGNREQATREWGTEKKRKEKNGCPLPNPGSD